MRCILGKLLLLFIALAVTVPFPRSSEAQSSLTSPEHIAALRERVAQGDMAAVHELGTVLQKDDDPSNDIEGRELLVRSANAGVSNSALYLAENYLYGWRPWALRSDGHADIAEAVKWLRVAGESIAADSEGRDTYLMLGDLYSENRINDVQVDIVPIDELEAIRWYRMCAVEFDTACEWRLGQLLLRSPESASEGFKWLKAAAKGGHPWSQRDLGELYKAGMVVKKDLMMALMWFEVSQRHNNRMGGDANAMFDSVAFEIDQLVKILSPADVEEARKRAARMAAAAKP